MSIVQQSYNQWAISYDSDRNLTRDLDGQVTADTLGALEFETVLELGCGTGKNTVTLAKLAQAVHSLDFSEEMMAQAKAKVAADHVRFSQADLTQRWPVEDESEDLVVANLVLEHIEDLGFIFGEAARVLRPNGRFFISELHPFRQYQGKKAVYEQDGEILEIDAYVHHVSEFLQATKAQQFQLQDLGEWWHEEDHGKLPRLLTLLFGKGTDA